jgi:hypothetical protein
LSLISSDVSSVGRLSNQEVQGGLAYPDAIAAVQGARLARFESKKIIDYSAIH